MYYITIPLLTVEYNTYYCWSKSAVQSEPFALVSYQNEIVHIVQLIQVEYPTNIMYSTMALQTIFLNDQYCFLIRSKSLDVCHYFI